MKEGSAEYFLWGKTEFSRRAVCVAPQQPVLEWSPFVNRGRLS